MYYEINVSVNGQHLFATHKRSLTVEYKMKELLLLFSNKFPATEGYNINVKYCEEAAEILDVNEIMDEIKYESYCKFLLENPQLENF
jgi:hypothetical protein